MGRRGQVSIEYMIIMGFAFALTIPLFIIFQQESNQVSDSITNAQVAKAGRIIADAVDTVYFYGEPSKRTIRVYFPKNIKSVTLIDGSITFLIDSIPENYEWSFSTETNVTGTIRSYEGIHIIEMVAQENGVQITD